MSWDDLSQTSPSWPPLVDVHAYRGKVYKAVREVIQNHAALAEGAGPINVDDPLWALFMAFEHERIHLETSSILMRELPAPLIRTPAGWPLVHHSSPVVDCFAPVAGKDYPTNPMQAVPGARVELGKPRDFRSFSWDNSYGHDTRDVDECDSKRSNSGPMIATHLTLWGAVPPSAREVHRLGGLAWPCRQPWQCYIPLWNGPGSAPRGTRSPTESSSSL
eukprot:scaffold424_cov69-Phaeocystis_antarctica.AAC.11